MKKIIVSLILTVSLLSFAACSNTDKDTSGSTNSPDSTDSSGSTNPTADALLSDGELDTGMKEKFDQMEYAAYVDLFSNENGSAYEGKTFTKDGTFAVLYDAFNDIARYYVWGYADNTKCCDWQWEFVLPDSAVIPPVGSYVKVKGTMTKTDAALDGYRLENVEFETKEEFKTTDYTYDMTTMSPTLVRVEVINMQQFPEKFKDANIRLFGRAISTNSIQHPYYNESWSLHFTETDTVPAIGDYILIEGVYNSSDNSGKVITTSKLTKIG